VAAPCSLPALWSAFDGLGFIAPNWGFGALREHAHTGYSRTKTAPGTKFPTGDSDYFTHNQTLAKKYF
jgi:hypothetical protein